MCLAIRFIAVQFIVPKLHMCTDVFTMGGCVHSEGKSILSVRNSQVAGPAATSRKGPREVKWCRIDLSPVYRPLAFLPISRVEKPD